MYPFYDTNNPEVFFTEVEIRKNRLQKFNFLKLNFLVFGTKFFPAPFE